VNGGQRWPSAATRVVGVIGDPIAHSLSPLLHNTAFAALGLDWVSVGYRVRRGEALQAIAGMRALGLAGLSVTMPHKSAVVPAADLLTASAGRLRAVNCLRWDGASLVGDNTDGEGFMAALRRGAGFDPSERRCAVIGAGGAARAVVLALADAGAGEVIVVNRTPERAADAAALAGARGRTGSSEEVAAADLVVNATPVGMDGGSAVGLVDAAMLGPGQVVVDLVYHPRRTPWLRTAEARGASVLGGMGMLVHQAAAQLVAWTGEDVPIEALWQAVGPDGEPEAAGTLEAGGEAG